MNEYFNPYHKFVGSFIPNCLLEYPDLSSGAKLLWARLSQHAGKNGKCYPSIETLAKELGKSDRRIQAHLKELQDKGFIEIVPPTGDQRFRHFNNSYLFLKHPVFDQIYSKSLDDDHNVCGDDDHNVYGHDENDVYNNKENPNERESYKNIFPSEKYNTLQPSADKVDIRSVESLHKRTNLTPIQFQPHLQKPPKDIYDIITYWNSSPLLPHLKMPNNGSPSTAIYKKTVERLRQLMQGVFFTTCGKSSVDRPFTRQDIISVIDRFKLAATNPDYIPANKDKIRQTSLYSFIHNDFSSHSYFLQYLEQEPTLLRKTSKPLEDPYPAYSEWIRNSFEKHVLMGQKPDWDQVQLNKFIEAGKKMKEAFYKLAPRVLSMVDQPYVVDLVVKGLVNRFSARGVTPGHLASDWTYKVVLPQELSDLGILPKTIYPKGMDPDGG